MKRSVNEIFHRKKLIITIFLLILGYGIYSYFVIPKQEMPAIDTPYMMISITVPSMNAREIEENIIDDVEQLVLTYNDVLDVRSVVYDNFSMLVVTFSFSTEDPDQLSEDIFVKVNELSLSDSISDISYSSSFDDPHIIFSVNSSSLSEVELLSYSESFRNQLMLVDEIKAVTIDSVFNKEIVITLDSDALALYGLTMTEVYQIIYANSMNMPLGGISTIYGTISISGHVTFDQISDLEELTIIPEVVGVNPRVTLSDLGTISSEDTSNKTYLFDGNNTTFLSVYFKDDIDFTKMGPTIIDLKEQFLDDQEDSALKIDEMLFLPDYVDAQITNVFNSLLIAIVVVMIVVFFGVGLRNSLLIVSTIPIVIFATIAILHITNYELHKLTIVGLIVAIGILVDNQIVITEGIKRNIDAGMDKITGAKQAILDNFAPVLSSTLTTIAAFVVIVMLPGFLGEIVSSMPLTVIIAISLSFVVAMVLSPVLAMLFLKPSKAIKGKSIHEERIKKMIAYTIRFPFVWILISVIMLVGSVYLAFSTQPIDLYPNDQRSVIYIDFENKTIGDEASTELVYEEIIDAVNDNTHLLNYASSIGGNLPNFHFSAKILNERSNLGRIYMNFDYNEDDLLKFKTELETTLKDVDSAHITVNVLELSPPVAPVRLFLQSDSSTTLDAITDPLFTEISESENVKSFTTTTNIKTLKYLINYDFDAMSSAFITKAEIDGLIAININGFDLDIFQFNNDVINVNLNSDITSYQEILDLVIHSTVLDTDYSLSDFITISEEYDYAIINRYDNKDVSILDIYPIDGVDNFTMEQEIKDIVATYDMSNITVTYTGENMMFEEISSDLIRASIIALILIFIIMFIQFNNFVKPLIVYLTIPLSFSGSFLFLVLFNSPITATALVGMVSLIGVTVNTGILLVEYISRHIENGDTVNDACVGALYIRFRPIMLTSFTTILGLIPLLISGGNFFRPLAITFMGGMVTSTLITIFLIPSVYSLIYKNRKPKIKKAH